MHHQLQNHDPHAKTTAATNQSTSIPMTTTIEVRRNQTVASRVTRTTENNHLSNSKSDIRKASV